MKARVELVFQLFDLNCVFGALCRLFLQAVYALVQELRHFQQQVGHFDDRLIGANVVNAQFLDGIPRIVHDVVDRARQAEDVLPVDRCDKRTVDLRDQIAAGVVTPLFRFLDPVAQCFIRRLAVLAEQFNALYRALGLCGQQIEEIRLFFFPFLLA